MKIPPLTTKPCFSTLSNMAAFDASKREWFLEVPINPGTLEKRLALRGQHIADAMPKVEAGIITLAASILSKPTEDGDNKDMIKAIATVVAKTEEEARNILVDDVYTREGIWDSDKIQVYPLRTGIRTQK